MKDHILFLPNQVQLKSNGQVIPDLSPTFTKLYEKLKCKIQMGMLLHSQYF